MMRGNNLQVLMDSHLEGNYSTEEATALVDLATQCLQYEPRDRPNTKKLVTILEPLQTKLEVSVVFLFLKFVNQRMFFVGPGWFKPNDLLYSFHPSTQLL
jgi:hypothetical protein